MNIRLSQLFIINVLISTLALPASASGNAAIRAAKAAADAQAVRAAAMRRAAQVQEDARRAAAVRQQQVRATQVQQNANRVKYAQAKQAAQKAPVVGRVANDVNKMNKNGTMTNYKPKQMRVRQSYHQGKLGELMLERNIYARGNKAVPQVRLYAGSRYAKPDFIEYHTKTNSITFAEAKTGAAKLTKAQSYVYPKVEHSGGAFKLAGDKTLYTVPATKVNVHHL